MDRMGSSARTDGLLREEGWIPSESGMDGGLDGWMNPFGRMNRMIPAGLGGRRKTSQLNTLEGDPSEMRCARHGHEFNGVNIPPQYDLRKLPQLNSPSGFNGASRASTFGKQGNFFL